MKMVSTRSPLVVVALSLASCSSDAPVRTDAAPDARRVDAGSPEQRPGIDARADTTRAPDASRPADGGAQCAALQKSYLDKVQAAKQCNLVVPKPLCMVKVDSELACPCQTYVDSASAELAALKAQWQAAGCKGPGTCGACKPIIGATCEAPAGSNLGVCKDK
jgi:hypothetical protein